MAVNNEFLSASFENKHSFKTGMTENYKNKRKNKIEKIKMKIFDILARSQLRVENQHELGSK